MACQAPQKKNISESNLGEINIPFTIGNPAKEPFQKGLLLLHSFEYDDARIAFQEAIKADSTEIMAYWGEAMSHYKALWGLQNVEAGRAVISQLGTTQADRLSKISDKLEYDFWIGVEILYGEGELYERNRTYAKHMANLYEHYPGNLEVAAFYALGLMWSVQGARDPNVFDLSSQVASGILAENPNHPGALHYLIHANDDPNYAELAKNAADKYARVAPDATHALHMPSHIYLALGMWNEVVASNEASYGASVTQMIQEGRGNEARGYHSYAWLHYGYLQQGRYGKAAQLLVDMQVYTTSALSPNTKSYLIQMQCSQRVESGEWLKEVEPLHVDYNDVGLSTQSSQHFFKALLAYDKSDSNAIKNEIELLNNTINKAELIVSDQGIAMCSAGTTRYAPSRTDITRARVITNQMYALIAMINKQDHAAEKYFREATRWEDQSVYSYGPPDITYPSYEQYGEWLLSKDRNEEALKQFDRSLHTGKNRTKALQGKIKALAKLVRLDDAAAVKQIMDEYWKPDLIAMN